MHLRLPSDLADKIKSIAERERRKVNGQVVLMLEQAVRDYEAGFAIRRIRPSRD